MFSSIGFPKYAVGAGKASHVGSVPLRSLQEIGRDSAGVFLYRMGRSIVSTWMRWGLDVDLQGRGLLPEGPKILAPNHPTSLDPFYILTLLREPVSVLVTAAAFNTPVFGKYLHAAGHIPAVRGSGGGTVEALTHRVETGHSVAIFPEGALSPPGGFHQPHTGLARVALRTGAPVIPVGISPDHHRIRVTRTWIDGEWVTAHLYTRGPYAMTVGRPLYFNGDARDRELVNTVSERIMEQIRRLAIEGQDRILKGRLKRTKPLLVRGFKTFDGVQR